MLAVIQRAKEGSVVVNQETVGQINEGIVALVAVEPNDTPASTEKLVEKILNYRIFSDQNGKMNLSIKDINGGLLLISQFTLAATTDKGLRPSFTSAAAPELAEELYDHMVGYARQQHPKVETGIFAADMSVSLVNDGPVTFLLKT